LLARGIVPSCGLYMKDFITAAQGPRWKLHGYGDPILWGLRFFRLRDTPYTVAGGPGNLSAVRRDEWFRLCKGVEPNMTLYGGGETYMDLKWWLLDSRAQ
jgi:hypothetical protein